MFVFSCWFTQQWCNKSSNKRAPCIRPFGHLACSYFYLSVQFLLSQRQYVFTTCFHFASWMFNNMAKKKAREDKKFIWSFFFFSFHLSGIGTKHVYVFWMMMIIIRDTNCSLAIKAKASRLLRTNAKPSFSSLPRGVTPRLRTSSSLEKRIKNKRMWANWFSLSWPECFETSFPLLYGKKKSTCCGCISLTSPAVHLQSGAFWGKNKKRTQYSLGLRLRRLLREISGRSRRLWSIMGDSNVAVCQRGRRRRQSLVGLYRD